jgi:hypothetical protein
VYSRAKADRHAPCSAWGAGDQSTKSPDATDGILLDRIPHMEMRELGVQSGGRPVRIFYAFDPRRSAILLIGRDKTGDKRFYETMIPIADRLYDEYIEELRKESWLP